MYSTDIYINSFSVTGSKAWNPLPDGVRNIKSVALFETVLERWLLDSEHSTPAAIISPD